MGPGDAQESPDISLDGGGGVAEGSSDALIGVAEVNEGEDGPLPLGEDGALEVRLDLGRTPTIPSPHAQGARSTP